MAGNTIQSTPSSPDDQLGSGAVDWPSGGSGGSTSGGSGSSGSSSSSSNKKTCILKVKYADTNADDGEPPLESVETYKGKKQAVTLTVTLPRNEGHLTRENYYFAGWQRTVDGGTESKLPGGTVEASWSKTGSGTKTYNFSPWWVQPGDTGMIAVYVPDDDSKEEYEISKPYIRLNGGGYVLPGAPSGSGSTTTGDTFTRKFEGALFTRTGYVQNGWSTTKGGEKEYDLEGTVPSSGDGNPYSGSNLTNQNIIYVLFPTWEEAQYTVTYHANTGTGEDYTETVTWGTDVEIKGSDFFSKTGYHIGSWNESEDATGLLWIPGETYNWTREGNVDLYAVWEGNEYTITYKDGSTDNLTIYEETAVYGDPFYTHRVEFPESRIYNSFEGWKADDNTILTEQDVWFGAYSYGSDPTWLLTRNMTLTPIFSDHYSFGKIFYGGRYSDDFGIYVEEPPTYRWAEYGYTHNKVPGRNGDVLQDSKRFENVEKTYKISAYDYTNFYSAAKKVSKWLNKKSSDKYMRLEDSYEPDVFRYAVYEESAELENIMAKAGQAEITFNCKPQRFLLSGEKPIKITQSGQVITNPTDQNASPIIIFRGSGELYINDRLIVAFWNRNMLYFDCDTYEAYDNAGNDMNYFIFTSDTIYLKPGTNIITFDETISAVSIVPRWWIV